VTKTNVAAAAVLGLTTSALLPVLLKPLLRRWRAMDVPVERSSHARPVLRGGGVAPAAGLLAASTALFVSTPPGSPSRLPVVVVGAASAACAALGLTEDLLGVPLRARAAAQVAIGAATSTCLVVAASGPWWLIPLGTLATAGYVNVSNFLDGINGISSLHGLVVGVSLAAAGTRAGLPWLTGSGWSLAAAFIAFLPWNIAGSGLFLGDAGSYLLGGTIAATSVAAVAAGVPFVVVLGPLVPYLTDSGVTLSRRMLQGERWYEAHRSHVYQVLASRHGHLPVATFVAAASALTAFSGALAGRGGRRSVVGVALMVLAPPAYMAVPRLDAALATRKELRA